MNRCSHCVFWTGQTNERRELVDTVGQCRRFPPHRGSRSVSADGKVFTSEAEFPVTRTDCWCGEFSSCSQGLGLLVPDNPTGQMKKSNAPSATSMLLSSREAAMLVDLLSALALTVAAIPAVW